MFQSLYKSAKKFDPFLDYLLSNQAILTSKFGDLASQTATTDVYIGVTAWHRSASLENQKVADNLLDRVVNQAGKLRWKLHRVNVSHDDEARYEAVVVQYAAMRNGLPPTDLLIGSGGGSVQISTDLGSSDTLKVYGIHAGFKKGQKKVMDEGLTALPLIKSAWETHTTDFIETNQSFVVK